MKQYLVDFASRFGGSILLNSEVLVTKKSRLYLFNSTLQRIAEPDFYYGGLYLGKVKNRVFFPSFSFLNILLPIAKNKVFLKRKAAWLFICGRDVFKGGLAKSLGSRRAGDYTLVVNEHNECLGFGVIGELEVISEKCVAVRNILDIGDFLRRERY